MRGVRILCLCRHFPLHLGAKARKFSVLSLVLIRGNLDPVLPSSFQRLFLHEALFQESLCAWTLWCTKGSFHYLLLRFPVFYIAIVILDVVTFFSMVILYFFEIGFSNDDLLGFGPFYHHLLLAHCAKKARRRHHSKDSILSFDEVSLNMNERKDGCFLLHLSN